MNAVLASVELLQRTPLDDVQQRLLGLACQGGESLLRLLNDVLDVSKLEAGKFVLEYEPADIAALVREVLDSLRKQAEEMGVELVFAVPDPIGFLMLDTSRTAQILQNLVSHAIGSTPAGRLRSR
ncbi:histidine kinase dimerization/phospho-acceptor domain-containing protein [Achromobacter xylosoxidans]